MFGLFSRNEWKLGVQVANLLVLTYSVYDLYQNPDKLAQAGFDITLSAANFLCLSEHGGTIGEFVAANLNFAGVGTAYASVTSNCPQSSYTVLPAILKATSNIITAGTLYFNSNDKTEQQNHEEVPNEASRIKFS